MGVVFHPVARLDWDTDDKYESAEHLADALAAANSEYGVIEHVGERRHYLVTTESDD